MILTLSQANELIAQKDFHILELTAKLESTQRQLTTLQHQMEQMIRRLYGRKSEQRNANQMMFDSIILEAITQNQGQGIQLPPTTDVQVEHQVVKTRKASLHHGRVPITPQHNELVEALLQSPCHIIATMRSKMEYSQSEEGGKKTVKKIGLAPVQREGMEYEFTVFYDIDINHVATASKDRTSLFDNKYFTPSTETGVILINWLNNAPDSVPLPKSTLAAKVNPETGTLNSRGSHFFCHTRRLLGG